MTTPDVSQADVETAIAAAIEHPNGYFHPLIPMLRALSLANAALRERVDAWHKGLNEYNEGWSEALQRESKLEARLAECEKDATFKGRVIDRHVRFRQVTEDRVKRLLDLVNEGTARNIRLEVEGWLSLLTTKIILSDAALASQGSGEKP